MNSIKINCFKVEQNNVEFFVGKLQAKELLKLCSVTHRAIIDFDEEGLPKYNEQIQRKPSPSRVKSIKNYLFNDNIASFPNNILISVPSILLVNEIEESTELDGIYYLEIDKSKVELEDLERPLYLQIFDGQHRFEGIKKAIIELQETQENDILLQKLEDFEFVISFFIEAEINFQAMLFSVINRTPVKVTQDLVFDLFGLTEQDSPQKTGLAIALKLTGLSTLKNGKKAPFYKRIRLLGKKQKGENSPISQGMFIKTIVKLICPSIQKSEEERFMSRNEFQEGGNEKTIFRPFYANNEDNLIYLTILNFFIAVDETFIDPDGHRYWRFEETGDNPLQRTIGFLALIEVLIKLFPIGMQEKKLSVDFFKNYLARASNIQLLKPNGETAFEYSSIGKSKLQNELVRLIDVDDHP